MYLYHVPRTVRGKIGTDHPEEYSTGVFVPVVYARRAASPAWTQGGHSVDTAWRRGDSVDTAWRRGDAGFSSRGILGK